MKTYNLLELVIDLDTNPGMGIYFFIDEEDAVKTFHGKMLCGNIKHNTEYLCSDYPFFEVRCDAVMDMYGKEYKFFYEIEP